MLHAWIPCDGYFTAFPHIVLGAILYRNREKCIGHFLDLTDCPVIAVASDPPAIAMNPHALKPALPHVLTPGYKSVLASAANGATTTDEE